MGSVTLDLWDFAAASAWEKQAAEDSDDGSDDESSGDLSPTAGLSPAELWLRSLEEPGATRRAQRMQDKAAFAKLTPLEQIKQRVLADAAAREEQARLDESLQMAERAATQADDDKSASRRELQQLHRDEDAERRLPRDGTARERFFSSLSRPKPSRQRPPARRLHRHERRRGAGQREPGSSAGAPPASSSSSGSELGSDSSSSSDEDTCDSAPDDDNAVAVETNAARSQTAAGRNRGARRRLRARLRAKGGAQSIIQENLRRAAAAAALPTPEENAPAKEAKARLMSQSDSDLHLSSSGARGRRTQAAAAAEAEADADAVLSGLGWGLSADDDEDRHMFGEQHVTLGAPGGWSQSEVAGGWGTLSGFRQDSNAGVNGQNEDTSSNYQRGKPLARWQYSRPRTAGAASTAGTSGGPSGLSGFGAILAQRSSSSSSSSVRPGAGGQAAIDGLDLQAGGDNSLGRTRALSAPTVRHAYDERLQADEAAEEEEDGGTRRSGRPATAGSGAGAGRRPSSGDGWTVTVPIHARLASAPLRREADAAALARAQTNASLPLVRREPPPTEGFSHWSAGHGGSGGGGGSGAAAKAAAGKLEQATRAEKFFRSGGNKRFGLQAAGWQPDAAAMSMPTAADSGGQSTAAAAAGVDGSRGGGAAAGPPPSSGKAAMTNRARASSSVGGVGGARANRNKSKWERYQRYGNTGGGGGNNNNGGGGGGAGSGGSGRASQRHVAMPMSVAGVSNQHRPLGVVAAACRVQRTRAVAPHVQGPNATSISGSSVGSGAGAAGKQGGDR